MSGIKNRSKRKLADESNVKSPSDNVNQHGDLIIGLDFGTTFSGIAFGFGGTDNSDIQCVVEWPGLCGISQPKINTLISYSEGSKGSFDWGAEALDKKPLVGIKLLLDPKQKRPLFVPGGDGKTALEKVGKSAEQVASDYIGALYRHANTSIETKYPKAFLDKCQRRYVVTVPAVWSDAAKNTTLEAAKAAGIHPVTLITEPEAAALYTVHNMPKSALETGDAIVVCDAGGGTVDLVSYEIAKPAPGLELKELVSSTGGMAGSLVLNKRFEQAVRDMLGEEDFFKLQQKSGWRKGMEEFDRHVKPSFKGSLNEDHLVNFPRTNLQDKTEYNLEDNSWLMTGQVLQHIFAPVIMEIERLVSEQVARVRLKRTREKRPNADEVKAIFLVGGFGANQYLKSHLQDSQPDIQIIQPVDAWSAISKGAVLSQLPSAAVVTSSIAARHYGVKASSPYNWVDDLGQRKRWNAYDRIYKCRKMVWYLLKGDNISRASKIKFGFSRDFDVALFDDSDLVFDSVLFVSDQDIAPMYPSPAVYEYVSAHIDLRGIDRTLFKRKRGSDRKFYLRVMFDLTITPLSGLFKFACEVNGKEYGSVEAKYL